jgi:SAM-dependent methyltransferase
MGSLSFFEAYGALARHSGDPLILAGRNRLHAGQMAAIVADVRAKLQPGPDDSLLEIGCNAGLLLTPLAGDVARAVGQDHPDLLEAYRRAGVPANVTLVPGLWPAARAEGRFDRILAYSVLHALPDAAAADAFVAACQEALAPGGRLLLGDIPNSDMQARFTASAEGAAVAADYDRRRAADKAADPAAYAERDRLFADAAPPAHAHDDAFALGLMTAARRRGLEAWLLPQPPGLPFHHTREDLLIWKRR